MTGIVCVNKPFQFTSFDVVACLRKILKIKKVGHSGTLDPIATGVLPVFVGKATKAIQFLQDTDKCYVAGFKFGQKTDTFDVTGNVVSQSLSSVVLGELKAELKNFEGTIWQTPPMFSAIKIKGKPAYVRARKGENFTLSQRKVTIFEIKCLEFDETNQTGKFFVNCSSGTYVRSICNELGVNLGVGCVLTSLVRTKACGFKLENCYSLDEIEAAKTSGKITNVFYKLENLFGNLKRIDLNLQEKVKFLNGAIFKVKNNFNEGELIATFFENKLLGLAVFKSGLFKAKKLFV